MVRTTTEFWLLMVGWLGLGIAALAAYGAVRTSMLAGRSARWPSVTGTIVSSQLEEYQDSDFMRRATPEASTAMYGADIRYRYQVGPTRYEGGSVGWGGGVDSNHSDASEAIVARYPVGRRIKVFYDPKDPAMAVLEPANRDGLTVLAIVAGGFALVSSILIAAPYLRWLNG
jgi:hypothetical protein